MRNEKNSAEYAALFERAKEIADASIGEVVTMADGDIISALFDGARADIGEDELFCGFFPYPGLAGRMSVRRRIYMKEKRGSEEGIACYEDGQRLFCYEGGADFGHTAPDFENVLTLGLTGLCERLKNGLSRDGLSDVQREYFESGIKVYDALFSYVKRMADDARALSKYEMADALDALTKRAPDTLYEAMVLMLLYYDVQTNAENTLVRTLGRLDYLFYPFYKRDVERGRLTPALAAALTDKFLERLESMKIGANIPFAIGGTRSDGGSFVNEYSYILLNSYCKGGYPDVKMHFLYGDALPRDFVRMAFEGIRSGSNSMVFISDAVTRASLRAIGEDSEDVERYLAVGCYETCSRNEIPCSCSGRINLVKVLEATLTGGYELFEGRQIAPIRNSSYNTFDELFDAYLFYLEYFLDIACTLTDEREKYMPFFHSSPLFSSTFDSCIEKGMDVYCGFSGKYNNSSINLVGEASAVDSLLAVRKIVFEDGSHSLKELTEILKNNWDGNEKLRLKAKNTFVKYGCGNKYADTIAENIVKRAARIINGRKNVKGGVYRLGAFSVDWRFFMGEKTAASADGRYRGEPLSKNISPSLGADKNGITGAIISAARIGKGMTPNGSVLDLTVHSSAAEGDDGLSALIASLATFEQMGGTAIHYNVLDAAVLRDAQIHPEDHPNLQVRLCGWNVLFSNLSRSEQDEFILQAEAK